MVKLFQKSNLVEYVEQPTFVIDQDWVERIKKLARNEPSKRYRTCIHQSDKENVHEMLIAHTRETYVRPHKHRLHRESLHIVEGKAIVVLFTDIGDIDKAWRVGDISTGRPFFYSLGGDRYHMMIIESADLVFKETTHGPFVPSDQIFPSWAPDNVDQSAVDAYVKGVLSDVEVY